MYSPTSPWRWRARAGSTRRSGCSQRGHGGGAAGWAATLFSPWVAVAESMDGVHTERIDNEAAGTLEAANGAMLAAESPTSPTVSRR